MADFNSNPNNPYIIASTSYNGGSDHAGRAIPTGSDNFDFGIHESQNQDHDPLTQGKGSGSNGSLESAEAKNGYSHPEENPESSSSHVIDPTTKSQILATKSWATAPVIQDRDALLSNGHLSFYSGTNRSSKLKNFDASFDESSVIDQELHSDNNRLVNGLQAIREGAVSGETIIERWRHPAFREAREVGIASIVTSIVLFIVEISAAVNGGSATTTGVAIYLLMNMISSSLVIWRFYDINTRSDVLEWRERVADFVISWSFVLMSIIIFGLAMNKSAHHNGYKDILLLMSSNAATAILLLVISHFKFHLWRSLDSPVAYKDALGTICSATIALGVGFGIVIELSDPNFWYADIAISVSMAFFMTVIGARSLQDMGQWWKKSFWEHNIGIHDTGIHDASIA